MASGASLALGTAQFGLDYGLTNFAGKLSSSEIERILQHAQARGISWLDTAAAYGDAEARIGSLLAGDDSFLICSKLLPAPVGGHVLDSAQHSLERSLHDLKRDRLDALLVHAPADLLQPRGENLWRWLLGLREQGVARSIGVSVYEESEIEALTERFKPDWIQLPASVLDQRLVQSGCLARLHAEGIRIQARSLLLQGVVTLQVGELPGPLSGLASALTTLHDGAEEFGVQTLDLALAWAAANPALQLGVVGVSGADELQQCVDAFSLGIDTDWSRFACAETDLLDPRKWPTGLRLKPDEKR
jgi:aryl-alcohol dehydrogenase-like predicted oxidoreductase